MGTAQHVNTAGIPFWSLKAYTRAVPSRLAVTKRAPSGLKATPKSADGLVIAAGLALARRQPERAARYAEHARCLTTLRAQLDEHTFKAAWAAGQLLPVSQAIEETLG
jgi:hypothetical protein